MPTLEQLEAALVKADAAGNVDDARALASAIKAARGASPAQPAPKESGWGREISLGARNVATGVTDVLGIVGNPINYLASKVTGQPYQSMSDATNRLLDQAGLAQPETAGERVGSDVGRAITGTGLTMGAGALTARAPGMVGKFGEMLSAGPKVQIASATTGAGASGVTRESGGGQGAQTAAGIIGAFSPAAANASAAQLTRLAARGGEAGRKALESNIRTFRDAGTEATVGQATERPYLMGAESLLAKAPGGAGVMGRTAIAQQEGIGGRVEDLANQLSTKTGPMVAGRAIDRGVTGEGGFLESFRAKSGELYANVDKFIPPQSPIKAPRTQAILAQAASPIPGAVNLSAMLSNPKLAGIREALEQDLTTNNGVIPYEALKQVRSKVGEMISDSGLVTDIPTKALKRLYGALSDDMGLAVQKTGNPQAVQAFTRANSHFRAGMDRIEVLNSVLGRQGGPEAVFNAALSGSREGATKLRAVMQSLPPESQKVVTATLVRRMGRAVNSKQDELGEEFSVGTFLTNWNAMSKEARNAAFGRFGPKYAANMDQIARATAISRKGSAMFANPAGTAAASVQIGTLGTVVWSLLSGHPGTAAAVGAGMVSVNRMAKAMTNPKAVEWLANTTRMPIENIGNQAIVLSRLADQEKDEDLKQLADQLAQVAQGQRNH